MSGSRFPPEVENRDSVGRVPTTLKYVIIYCRDPDQSRKADVAQLVEQLFRKQQVSGSIPLVGFASGQLFRKQQVASSILAVGFLFQ